MAFALEIIITLLIDLKRFIKIHISDIAHGVYGVAT